MKITVIGATGFVGPEIVKEALSRGHQVTAVSRSAQKLNAEEGLTRAEGDALDWTYLSPAALLEPGPRTGKFRLGTTSLLMQGENPTSISVADLAVAILDEIEQPQHIRQQFTAGY